MAVDEQQAAVTCRELLGAAPEAIEYPGGKSRDSVRAIFGDHSLILTWREDPRRAELEALVLRTLNEADAPAPRLVARSDQWLVQQDLGGERLPEFLDSASSSDMADAVARSLAALAAAQQAGRDAGLHKHLIVLGEKPGWFTKLLARPAEIGELLGVHAPALDEEALSQFLRVREPAFVKWDARPGNVIRRPDGGCYLIDWEHAGCRNPLDDVVWLLADEYAPDLGPLEESLFSTVASEFAPGWSTEEALDYLYTYGVMHGCVRLHYCLREGLESGWRSRQDCVARDSVGAVKEFVLRQCERGQRWSARSSLLSPMVGWFSELAAKFKSN